VWWVVTTGIGWVFGSAVRVPPGHPLLFASVAAFLSILVGLWRGPRVDLAPWLAAGLLALAAHRAGLPAPLPLVIGSFGGAALGAWVELRWKSRPMTGGPQARRSESDAPREAGPMTGGPQARRSESDAPREAGPMTGGPQARRSESDAPREAGKPQP
jgi:hypothetical protein